MSIDWTGYRYYVLLSSRFDQMHKRWISLLCPMKRSELAFSKYQDTSFRICITNNKDNP